MSLSNLRNTMEWALMVALVFGAGAIAQAQNEDATNEGRIVQIGPSDEATTDFAQEGAVDVTPVEQPKHWIGLLGGELPPELRAHLEIPADQGLLVRQVVPDSPAAKAGLENFDILLRADETDLHDMADLVEIVKSAGDQSAQITLEVLRHGKRETVYITPEARPERIATMPTQEPQAIPGFGGQAGGIPDDVLRFFEQRGGREGGPFAFRMQGPGQLMPHRGEGLGGMPSGISVSIQKPADGPAHITVKRGNERWEVVGDDPGSLEQLPDDVRPFVEQLLQGGGGIQIPMPELQNFHMPMRPGVVGDCPNFNDGAERYLVSAGASTARPCSRSSSCWR